ncbi:MAG: hypothetical protein ACREM1_13970 [Longimicrobiales bacterium]
MTTTSTCCRVILLCCLVVTGCAPSEEAIANGEDPLEALTVPHRSDRYTTTYWRSTSKDDSELWARAVDYCEDKRADYPNCEAVRSVAIMERMTEPPEDRPNDFSLTVPQDDEPDTSRNQR